MTLFWPKTALFWPFLKRAKKSNFLTKNQKKPKNSHFLTFLRVLNHPFKMVNFIEFIKFNKNIIKNYKK